MKCTDKERETCNVEKMGCEGCYYNEDNDRDIEELKILFYSDKLTQYGKRKFIEYYEQRIKAYKELEEKLDETLNANLALVQGNANSIPVSLVEEKIEELNRKIKYENNEKVIIWLHKQRKILQELLEKR